VPVEREVIKEVKVHHDKIQVVTNVVPEVIAIERFVDKIKPVTEVIEVHIDRPFIVPVNTIVETIKERPIEIPIVQQ
jgi:hypothetical protein